MRGSLKMLALVLLLMLSSLNFAYASEMTGKLQKISDQPFLFPALSDDGKDIFYFDCRGDKPFGFYQMSLTAGKATIISVSMDTPDSVCWSPTRRQAVIGIQYNRYIFEKYHSVFARPGTKDQQITYWLYDFSTRRLSFLPIFKFLGWSDDGKKIMYIASGDDRQATAEVMIADSDLSKKKKVYRTNRWSEHQGGWIGNSKVFYFSNPSDVRKVAIPILVFDLSSGHQGTLASCYFQVWPVVVSPDKTKLIFGGSDISHRYRLWTLDLKTNKSQEIKSAVLCPPLLNWSAADKIIIAERTFELLRVRIIDIKTGQDEKLNCPELEQLQLAVLSGNAAGGPSGQKSPVLDFIWAPSSRSLYINVLDSKIKGLYRLTPTYSP